MKHFAQITPVLPTKYLHCAITGRVIDSRSISFDAGPDWIKHAIASWCECHPDDIGCIETDEGDAFTVDGEIVATLSLG